MAKEITAKIKLQCPAGQATPAPPVGPALGAHGVNIAQFVKGMRYSELDSLERFGDALAVEQFGRDCFIKQAPEPADIAAARAGYDKVARILRDGDYDVVVLDEANIATHFGLFSVDELLALVDARPDHVELVITGRKADPRLLDRADLVTEMREVKHYYQQGVEARKGFES